MAETKAPEIDEAEDGELASIAQSVAAFDEPALRALYKEKGFTDAEAEMFIAPMKATNETNKRLLQRDQRQAQNAYVAGLKEQFPYAFDADGKPLFTGSTKAEMRRSAEKLHAHTASLVGASKTAETAKPKTAATDERAEEWGVPPAGSGETVVDRGGTFASWDKMRSDTVHGKAADLDTIKEGVIADMKANGARPMRRKTLGQIAARMSDEARAASKA